MGIFHSDNDLKKQLKSLQETNYSLSQEIEDNHSTISGFMDVKSNYDKQMLNLKHDYEDKVQKITKQYESTISDLKSSIEIEKKSINRKVNIALANIGVKSFVPEEISANISPQQSLERFMSMPNGKEKEAFFKTNESIISRTVGLKK